MAHLARVEIEREREMHLLCRAIEEVIACAGWVRSCPARPVDPSYPAHLPWFTRRHVLPATQTDRPDQSTRPDAEHGPAKTPSHRAADRVVQPGRRSATEPL